MLRCLYACAQVCQGPECKSKLSQGCSRLLACGHWCGGVAGETDCLPCLHVSHLLLSLPLAHLRALQSTNQSINILNVLGCHWNPTHNSFSSVSLYSQICLLHPWVMGSSLHVITISMLVTHSLAILCISLPPVCSCFYFCFFLFLFLPCISPPLLYLPSALGAELVMANKSEFADHTLTDCSNLFPPTTSKPSSKPGGHEP